MIKVDILVNPLSKKIYGIELKGHAESAPYGQDLVCAAVSAIITGGANAIENQSSFDIQLESGKAKIKLKEDKFISSADESVLKVIAIQLKTIAESYGQFIETIVKERI